MSTTPNLSDVSFASEIYVKIGQGSKIFLETLVQWLDFQIAPILTKKVSNCSFRYHGTI